MTNQQHTKKVNRLKWAASNERGLANKYPLDSAKWQEHTQKAREFAEALQKTVNAL